ncbi:adenosine kinase [cyanobiont of Ornithocercus magnificus]|nr:adenosine kinase [cyanobiont of Ornithocercus magnificus]
MAIQTQLSSSPVDVVGIGNAIVDILVQVQDYFLERHGLVKGTMTLVDQERVEAIQNDCDGTGIRTSGGSAANTLAGLAQLGSQVEFVGRVRDDQLGMSFTHDIHAVGAHFNTPPIRGGAPTACCLILVTPDAQRTMCTFLGASVQLGLEDLDFSIIRQTKVLYLEGYLWDSLTARCAFLEAARTCQESGGQVALSLSDTLCVSRHREEFQDFISRSVDVLFANESEITTLYSCKDFESALLQLKREKCYAVAALTRGNKGSVVLSKEQHWDICPYILGSLVDTTGAGDLYAGGFLHGYTNGLPFEQCGHLGSLCAGQIVTHLGSRSKTSLQGLVRHHLKWES